MSKTRKHARPLRRTRLALALVGAMAMPMAVAQNLPTLSAPGVGYDPGQVTITDNTMTMTVNQSTRGAIINWGTFNIGGGYGVTFVVPDSQSVTLNRVVGSPSAPSASGASWINGSLTSNGHVFLINPAGVVFGSGATVDVQGLVASTLQIDDGDFDAGRYVFSAPATGTGSVVNSGSIQARSGGTVALLGARVANNGSIRADHGSVLFGAAGSVTLDFQGDGLTQITIAGNGVQDPSLCQAGPCGPGIVSGGSVSAPGGWIDMRTNTRDGQPAVGSALNTEPSNGGRIWITGSVSAPTDGTRRGSITLDAGAGNVDIGGVSGQASIVSARGDDPGEQAGSITIRGNQLFQNGCHLDASLQCLASDQAGLILANGTAAVPSAATSTSPWARCGTSPTCRRRAWPAAATSPSVPGRPTSHSMIAAWGEGAGAAGGNLGIRANNLSLVRGTVTPSPYPSEPFYVGHASLVAFGNGGAGGNVQLDVSNMLSVVDHGDHVPSQPELVPLINATGGTGGSIGVRANSLYLPSGQRLMPRAPAPAAASTSTRAGCRLRAACWPAVPIPARCGPAARTAWRSRTAPWSKAPAGPSRPRTWRCSASPTTPTRPTSSTMRSAPRSMPAPVSRRWRPRRRGRPSCRRGRAP